MRDHCGAYSVVCVAGHEWASVPAFLIAPVDLGFLESTVGMLVACRLAVRRFADDARGQEMRSAALPSLIADASPVLSTTTDQPRHAAITRIRMAGTSLRSPPQGSL